MCHVLIIEDEPMIAMLLQDILEETGATSFAFAATELDAVRLAVEQPPSVITSDVRLLEGTGLGAVEEIRRKLGEVPVVFITASPEACERHDPPITVLIKPFNVAEAKAVFQRIIPSRVVTQRPPGPAARRLRQGGPL